MVDAKEIRVGNWFEHDDSWNYAGHKGAFRWEERDWYAVGESVLYLEHVSPLKLTAGMILDVGFEKSKYIYEIGKGATETYFCLWKFPVDKCFYWEQWRSMKIEYCHELQNLFYILYKKELILKP